MKTKYELIVFDWDGTLMDSTGHIVDCMREAIVALDLPLLSDTEISHIIGLGLHEAVSHLYPDLEPAKLEQLGDKYREVWLSNPHQTPLFANAEPLLNKLSQGELFLGVATGKSRRGLDKMLVQTGLGDLFHATRCADECHSKPHPQMLEELMDFTGVSAKQTLMIGDTEFDMLMAKNAGADCLAITHGAHAVEKLQACDPVGIVADLFEVEHWLTNQ
jgi:phosphoglycolate phosphatase